MLVWFNDGIWGVLQLTDIPTDFLSPTSYVRMSEVANARIEVYLSFSHQLKTSGTIYNNYPMNLSPSCTSLEEFKTRLYRT